MLKNTKYRFEESAQTVKTKFEFIKEFKYGT